MCCLLRAYQFLSLVLLFLIFQPNLSSSSSSGTQLCSHHEAAALIQFKSSFSITETYSSWYCDINTATKSYAKTDSWKEGTDCCSWDGVTCNVKCHVIGLDLSCSGLYGNFPSNSSLFLLPHLRKLNLAYSDFIDSKMPSMFGRFASLLHLNLSNTFFSGKVPSQVSHLSKLVSLDLSGNDGQALDKHTLEGLVQNLTDLRQLFLDRVNMSSINPNVLMNLSSSLMSLSLYDCDLRGKFPANIFNLPNLKLLNLGDNLILSLNFPKFNRSSHLENLDLSQISFSTELIDSIDNLKSLKYLYLLKTSFSGGLPESITNLLSLENLVISGADFSGGLPYSMGNLVSLRHLDLLSSNLSGSIPRSMGNLSQLSYIELSGNCFSGQLPYSLTNLTQLQVFQISDNSLEGSIPDEVTAFPNLISLDFSSNLLSGTLPSWLYTVSSLKYIYLMRNKLSGHIKEFQCKSLEVIYLGHNKLQGPIPSSISQLVNLTDLYLSSNNLSGIVEFGMFSKLQNLRGLDLSYNSIALNSRGTSTDYMLPNLQNLYLSSCNVNEFPQFLRGSKSLLALDLSNNGIYGKIPNWMWDIGKDSLSYLNLSRNSLTEIEQLPWRAINYLDLSSNLIHGNLPIPPWTTNVFFIANNRLSGEISFLICNMSSLQILDLSRNSLSGNIPQCFGDLSKNVSMLNLGMNRFSGIIPPTFAKGCQLSNLNLNGNHLEGPLTRSIMNCKGLEVLDLGNNKINDTFPHWLGSLPQLQVLVLQSNQLHGSIQDTRSNLSFPKIQIFDLSSNYFTGPLPERYIKNFKAMINLSKNESAMPYMGFNSGDRFYTYSIGIVMKGLEMELVKIFTMLTSIGLSNNKFEGEIPKVIGKLNSLKGLNLSHNNFSGCIPTSIGNLISLEWLDLSSNKLVGKIPERLLDLTSLSFLNVSENQLDGLIPQGKQFNTFGNDSYEGNKGLCGFPVSKGCNINDPPPSNSLEEDGSKSNFAFGWKVVLIGYGCGVVFGLAVGYIVFQTGKPKWFMNLVENQHHKMRRKSKIGNRSGG